MLQKLDVDLWEQAMRVVTHLRPVEYARLTPELIVAFASPGFATVLPQPMAVIEGQPLSDVLWEFAGLEDALTAVFQQERPIFTLERINRTQAAGGSRYFDFHVTHLSVPEPGLLLVAEDVTAWGALEQELVQERNELDLLQRRLAQANEQLQRLDQMKSLFLSMAAHDLRSPLTAVAGYTELLQKNGEMVSPTKRSEFLTIIQTQVKRLNRLIDDILNLDQIERGLLQIERLPVDLNQLVRDSADDFAYLVARNQHNLQTNLTEDALVLPFDESKMQQVLYNLLSNAVKYTPHGGEIQVTTRREGETAVIEVADTGLGMTAEQVSHLFELYYRSDEVRSRKIQGTGLGLFIVRSLVEAHGGTISVQSEPDAGSVFTISLPL
ncbi:MAG: hypothetical protein KC443_22755 [Anaerolineales bacterium]|nr:hypothetical protein [Anaerolineales bacterium]